ncbi:hypothetical protein [Streptococcus iniae]|uniref:hypothetical protein n=1 Tax=Streptococcus iniae TaxID=1346 RepID=UPI0003034D82|nr:hypothetical protein [Streptococcus iniae]ESR08752.1 hypothetical protein IUSA1_10735 [Streptococcus iniae IUSA1]
MIEKDEFLQTLDDLESVADGEQDKLLDEAKELLLELKKIADKSLKLVGQTNDLYEVLFYDVVKDDQTYKRTESGAVRWLNWPDYRTNNKVFVYSYYDSHVKNTYLNPEKEVK